MTSIISNKNRLMERAKDFCRTTVFVPDKMNYVTGWRSASWRTVTYQADRFEPIVEVEDIFPLGDSAFVTVNDYNAVVLNSTNMFIADIDYGDPRLCKHARAECVGDVSETLQAIALLDSDDEQYSNQTFRLYMTHSGCRVICSSIPAKAGDWWTERLFRFLRSDPKYVELCAEQKTFRARLTPKPWRDDGTGCTCVFYGAYGDDTIHPDLAEQIRLHDDLTLGTEYQFLA